MNTKHPNILLVFADQLRAGMTGAEGNRQAITPAIDRLAREGVLVGNCISNTPVCCPSRATMFTGTYPIEHRVVSNDLPIRTDLPTLAGTLKQAGYRTGYIGKWHLDGVPRGKFTPPGSRRLGFDDFWAAYNCSHSYFDPKYYTDSPQLIRAQGYEPTVQTDLALEFLDAAAASDQPFALAVSWGPPHDPYDQAPQRFRDLFDPRTIALRPNVIEPIDNPLARGMESRRTTADYYAAISALDAELDRLLASLDRLRLADRTLVVFTSDHGDMLWSHGYMKKQSPYEESVHVPMILRGPTLARGVRSPALIGLMDLMPTLLGLAGCKVPPGVQGRDFSQPLTHHPQQANGQDVVLIAGMDDCDEAVRQQMPQWRGVRTHNHTYVEKIGRIPWLLFDHHRDPFQMNNLIDDSSSAPIRSRLTEMLQALLDQYHDPFVSSSELFDRLHLTELWRQRTEHMFG